MTVAFDQEIRDIAEYVCNYSITESESFSTARYCLMDAIGCAFLALNFSECSKLLGPIVPNTLVPLGARVLGTALELDPILASFNNGLLIRWLDFNDTWLAAEWGHPSDNLGAILSVADFQSRQNIARGLAPLTMKDVLTAMIKAYEIQGVLALKNSFNRLGLDHVILVKIASTAIATQLLGGKMNDVENALSQAFVDGQSLRTYRHAPNTGSRKSWSAGDATSRGVHLAWLTLRGEMGYSKALSAQTWGFNAVTLHGDSLHRDQPYAEYVMQNILFKVAFPAEFHAQTAVECAVQLHPQIKDRLDKITKIKIYTQESAMRIISKTGKLSNPADRDHCLQYMIAIGLIWGDLTADHYEDGVALDPRIDILRSKMEVLEDPQFTKNYLDPHKRAIANSIEIIFSDNTSLPKVSIEYPLGHRRRREKALPLIKDKFIKNISSGYSQPDQNLRYEILEDLANLLTMSASRFMDLFSFARKDGTAK